MKKQKCLLVEAKQKLIEEIGLERANNYPIYVSCPCPKCTPRYETK